MKSNKKSFTRAITLGLSAATLIAAPAFANPFTAPALSSSNHSTYAEAHNVPRFKMTYSSLHTASLKRQKRAEMAAMELKRKEQNAKDSERQERVYETQKER